MAYLALSEGSVGALLPTPFFAPTPSSFGAVQAEERVPANDVAAAETARLSALEWSVVALARHDSVGSLREPGRISKAFGALFGLGASTRLADGKLEALRRIAVLAWRYGYVIPSSELKAFLAAGFSADQYELVQTSIGRARADRR